MAVQHSADHDPADDIRVIELTREEGLAMFDRQARERLGMSGEEFLRKWDAGEIEDPDRNDVMMLVMLIPFTASQSVMKQRPRAWQPNHSMMNTS